MNSQSKPKMNLDLRHILRPQAASRWLLPGTNNMSPAYVESTLRGALAGNHVLQWELFDLMEDTWPRLTKNLNELKRAVIARDWKCKPWAEEDLPPTESAVLRHRLVSRALWTMRPGSDEDANGFERTIYDLLDSWGKGVSVLEIDWEQRPGGPALGDIFAPRSTWWVHPSNYAWSDEGWLGLVQNRVAASRKSAANIQHFEENKFLIAQCKARTGHPLAGALLRPLAFWWAAANFTANWFFKFAELFGMPFRWANYDEKTSGLFEKVKGMLEDMGSTGWGAFPNGTTLDFKEPLRSASDNPQVALLDRADTQCDILILGQTLTTSTPARGGGTRAQGEVHLSVREDVIQAAADFAASVINLQLVPMILRLNFGDDAEAPEFCPEPKRIEDQKQNAETLQAAVNMGVPVPVKWAQQKLGIPQPQEGEEILGNIQHPTPNIQHPENRQSPNTSEAVI